MKIKVKSPKDNENDLENNCNVSTKIAKQHIHLLQIGQHYDLIGLPEGDTSEDQIIRFYRALTKDGLLETLFDV